MNHPAKVRTRFAPSPTGTLHLGGLRTALYNYAFAKHHGGDFIIRVEDTDEARSSRAFEEAQIKALIWAGVIPDESPQKPGAYGPYRQSERLEIYQTYAQKLIQKGHAFYCFCSDEELEAKALKAKEQGLAPQYDGTCRHLSRELVEQKLKAQEAAVIRFKAFQENKILKDLIRGAVEFKSGMVGDFVILRANGMPVYNFAVVIDDALMEITHVIRAEEHLPNTYRQIMIYEALHFPMPHFAHLSLVQGRDADGLVSKLSKRHGAVSTDWYEEEGFLPEAICNYITLLGWSSPDALEKFDREYLIKNFSLDRISKSPSTFDPEKLKWLNGLYLREMKASDFVKLSKPYLEKAGRIGSDSMGAHLKPEQIEHLILAVQNNCSVLKDVVAETEIFFDLPLNFENASLEILRQDGARTVIETLAAELSLQATLDRQIFKDIKKTVQNKTGKKGKDLFMPLRVALTGKSHGPDLDLVVDCLPTGLALNRVQKLLNNWPENTPA